MFVALNPSTSEFPTPDDLRFYRHLKRNGFGNAHLTDVVKERASANRVREIMGDPRRMEQYRRYLTEEIAVLDPRLIVGVGHKAYNILSDWLGDDSRLKRIRHYAERFPKRRRFAAEMMGQIRREYTRKSK